MPQQLLKNADLTKLNLDKLNQMLSELYVAAGEEGFELPPATGGGGLDLDPVVKTASFTAEANKIYMLGMGPASYVVTLPATPAAGTRIAFSVGDIMSIMLNPGRTIEFDLNGAQFYGAAQGENVTFRPQDGTLGGEWMYVSAAVGWVSISNNYTYTIE